ncbi:MAG: polyphosphate polymerase domain-containing protein [Clostridiales bacterium]|nr:polyphosphate polymerase domain-containing protein [Clostridiales bacterium]
MMNTLTAPVTVDPNDPIAVMKRYELKYVLSEEQTAFLKEGIKGDMRPDSYGLTTITSLYYDTPDHRLIRESLDKPDFKEKIRLRSYGQATVSSPVFLELKRKAYGIVYKRRVQSTVLLAERFFDGESYTGNESQIQREITNFIGNYNNLRPSCIIIYDRTAYFEPDGDLRLTIDENPRYRMDDLDLTSSLSGIPLLNEGGSILEIKVQDAIPLWLSALLSKGRIYKNSFSKYGEAYRRELLAAANQ